MTVYPDLGNGFRHHRRLRAPDDVWIVLHPSGFWKNLGKFVLRCRTDVSFAVEYYSSAAACPLIEGENVVFHSVVRLSVELSGFFYINGFGEYGNRIEHRDLGRHFDLPFACLAVARHEVASAVEYLAE